jgi:hypothetical protein
LVLGVVVIASGAGSAGDAASCTLSSCPGFPVLSATVGGGVSPRKLPRNHYVPVTAKVFGKIATSDGTHPSALREAFVDIDKDVRVRVRGLPVCRASIDIREPNGGRGKLEKACHNALIGRGEAQFEIAFPEQKPIVITSPIAIFNR